MNDSKSESDRKSEELYRLARDAYASSEKRFDDAEGKIAGYLSVLFVVLGLATISIDAFRTIVTVGTLPNIAFGLFTIVSYLCGLVAFAYFIRALAVQQVRALRLDTSVSRYFERYTLSASFSGLAEAFFGAAGEFRRRTQEKLHFAHRGFISLLAAVAFTILAACNYFFIESSEDNAMSIDMNGGNNGDEQQSSTSEDVPSDDATQAAEDAAQLFEDMKKGFEGGDDREEG